MAVTAKIFDSEGVALVNTLNEGADGVERLMDTSRMLRGELSELDTDRIAKFNDTLNEMSHAIDGLQERATVFASQGLDLMLKKMTAFAINLAQNKQDDIPMPLGDYIEAAADAMFKENAVANTMVDMFYQQAGARRELAATMVEQAEAAEELKASAIAAEQAEARILQTVDDQNAALQRQIDTWGMSSAAVRRYDAMALHGGDTIDYQTHLLLNQVEAIEEQQRAMDKLADDQERMAALGERVFDRTRTPLERFNAEMERMNELLGAGAISQDTFGRASSAAAEALERATRSGPASRFRHGAPRALEPGSLEALRFQQQSQTPEVRAINRLENKLKSIDHGIDRLRHAVQDKDTVVIEEADA